MYNNDQELKQEDVKKIINGLMCFIVNDSRKYVDKEKRNQYIRSYLELLDNIIQCKEVIHHKNFIENIIKDIDSIKNI